MDEWSPEVMGWWFFFAALILVVYYVFVARAILQMLREHGHPVLLAFACLSLIPVPPLVLMGIVLIIVWSVHRGGEAPAPAAVQPPAPARPAPRQAARRRR